MAEKLEVLEVQVPHLGYTEWHVVREGDYMPLAECDGEEWARLFAAAPELHDQLAAATARAEDAEARVTELERILGNWMFINGALTTAIEALREGDFKRHLWNDFSQVLDDTMRALRAQEPGDD